MADPLAHARVEMSVTKIYWTDEEYETVANEVVRLRLVHPFEGMTALIDLAQQALPKDRHRSTTIMNRQSSPKLFELIEGKMTVLRTDLEKARQPATPQPKPTPNQFSIEELVTNIIRRHTYTTDVKALNNERELGLLRKQLEEMKQRVDTLFMPTQPQSIVPSHIRDRKAKVVVVGPVGQQIQEITKAVNGKVEPVFLAQKNTITNYPKADYAVLFTRFANHDLYDKLVSVYGKDKVRLHAGGISGGIEVIRSLA